MSERRLDDLLEETLATAARPEDLTEAGRAEMGHLLRAASALKIARESAQREASDSMPAARARLERSRAEGRRVPPSIAPVRRAWVGRRWLTAGSLAAVLVVSLAVVVALQPFGRQTGTASAIEPGDFVQLAGRVESVEGADGGHMVDLSTAVGSVALRLSGETVVTDGTAPVDAGALHPGSHVLVVGTVGSDGLVVASTMALQVDVPAVGGRDYQRLRDLRAEFAGTILLLALADDGPGDVLVETEAGRRVLVPVDAESIRRLAAVRPGLVGSRVAVQPGAAPGQFALALTDGSRAGAAAFTMFGTVTGFERGQLVLATEDGSDVTVRLRRETRVLLPSGEEVEHPFIAGRRLIGREISVQGAALPDGSIAADLVAVGGG